MQGVSVAGQGHSHRTRHPPSPQVLPIPVSGRQNELKSNTQYRCSHSSLSVSIWPHRSDPFFAWNHPSVFAQAKLTVSLLFSISFSLDFFSGSLSHLCHPSEKMRDSLYALVGDLRKLKPTVSSTYLKGIH